MSDTRLVQIRDREIKAQRFANVSTIALIAIIVGIIAAIAIPVR